ncbi:unnamed protein product [Schistosoma margrebowiei]|uniref:Uncharacterized protein n=1 Tax=Schistosoma margrebowiei TaxID=48269 RepID=A0A3P8EIK1_9TREM|nr:unnamed protein product [Schistosoma margrebowiei]
MWCSSCLIPISRLLQNLLLLIFTSWDHCPSTNLINHNWFIL